MLKVNLHSWFQYDVLKSGGSGGRELEARVAVEGGVDSRAFGGVRLRNGLGGSDRRVLTL